MYQESPFPQLVLKLNFLACNSVHNNIGHITVILQKQIKCNQSYKIIQKRDKQLYKKFNVYLITVD